MTTPTQKHREVISNTTNRLIEIINEYRGVRMGPNAATAAYETIVNILVGAFPEPQPEKVPLQDAITDCMPPGSFGQEAQQKESQHESTYCTECELIGRQACSEHGTQPEREGVPNGSAVHRQQAPIETPARSTPAGEALEWKIWEADGKTYIAEANGFQYRCRVPVVKEKALVEGSDGYDWRPSYHQNVKYSICYIGGCSEPWKGESTDLFNAKCTCESHASTIQSQLTSLIEERDKLKNSLFEEEKIVDKIWAMFGMSVYEDAGGKSIYEHIETLNVDCDRLAEALKLALNTFSNKCEGQHKWPKTELQEALAAHKKRVGKK